MTMQQFIEQRLRERFSPVELLVVDDSQKHHGHAGWREGGQTHYQVRIVAEAFRGLSRVAQHRLVNEALAEAFQGSVHALALETRVPD